MPHGIRETVGWVLGFAVLLIVLYAVDGGIRHRLWRSGDDLFGVRWSNRLSAVGDAAADAVRGQGIEGALLATFLVVAVLLVWLMVRN